jgi:hypothetical protein
MSRLNRDANYIYVVDGETVWERLRVIRGFLEDRRLAYEINKLSEEKVNLLDKDSYDYREYLLRKPQQDKIMQECLEEIVFLEEFEHKLTVEAEKTRIPGKSDDEMYEINFFDEMKVRLMKEAQSELISIGQISPTTMKSLLRCKPALEGCVELGMLNNEIFKQINIPLLGTRMDQFLLESPKKE